MDIMGLFYSVKFVITAWDRGERPDLSKRMK